MIARFPAYLAAAAGFLAAGLAAGAVQAAEGDWARVELMPGVVVEGRLIAAVDGAGELESVPAGLHVVLPDGWKTYWRSPGDAGLPPEVDWTGSTNLADANMAFPAPHRFTLFGLQTFGYEHEVVFPLTLTPEIAGAPLALSARADLLVCADLCIPATFDLALDIPAGPASVDGEAANLIERHASRVPGDGAASGLSLGAITLEGEDALVVTATAREPFEAPDIFVETTDLFWAFGAPEMRVSGDRLTATLPILQTPNDAASLAGAPVTITLVDGARSMEQAATVEATAMASGPGFPTMLGIALLGGLILNLMPCVLPVLSIKLLSVAGYGGQSPGRVRLGFLASSAGILVSFMGLAAAAIAARAAGGAVGWGIQFQQPLFIVAMVVILTLFACNLLGLFEIRLPSVIADRAGRLTGNGLAGSFATGAFATLLATPCSAPFLGTAVGFALSRGPVEILAIFTALGLGLALPYLAVAAFPKLAAALPRPGRWMIVLRRILSLFLAATALWLLSVLAAQLSAPAAIAVGLMMVVLTLILWARGRFAGGARWAGALVAAALALGAFVVPGAFDHSATARETESAASGDWTAFDRDAIGRLVADGRVVFVDVTADWCITCQANKTLVLQRGAVADALDGEGVTPMRADWTSPDDGIAAYLADHGRYGIPFNIVYGPAAPEGIPLPEILTEEAVMDALAQAGLES
ncbi:protein-disulfide reductase DsbD domain-containing protein [Inquilinus sp. CAU 1745]|uniref:protein-disulfide reductase DsbD family protein n=1 Tax=Inquilinus sp. CAU 1745 TaxID=3140369 RepID=UPI00325B1C51